MIWRILLFVLGGAALGFGYQRLIGCRSGTCVITMELLRRVAHEHGTAVVVVTHDHRSLDVFDAIYQMEDGRLTGSSGE